MTPDPASVDRLGFEAWADNVIVNALEDLAGDSRPEIDVDQGDVVLVIRADGQEATATLRAYVSGRGWMYHDRVIKLKGGRQ